MAGDGRVMSSSAHALVRDLAPFKDLAEPEARTVLVDARLRRVAEGGHVFAQGAPALRFFFLAEGRLKIVQASPEVQQIIAHWVAPGQFFGLAVAMGREDYPGTAVAALLHRCCWWCRSQGQCRRFVPSLIPGCPPCLSN